MTAELREPRRPVEVDAEGITLEPRRRLELLQDCRELVLSQLSRLIGEALDRLDVELTDTAMKETQRDSQQSLLEALSLVRKHRNDIEYRFRESFAELFERRLYDRDGCEAGGLVAGSPDELSLVDDDAIDHRIAFDRLVRRARGRLDPDEVLGMRARLAALLDREWFDEDDYPASPELVFEALQRSLDDLEPATEVREALLQAFEPHVTTSLNRVYATVNERLKSQRVLPRIRPRAVGAADARRAAAAPGDAPNAAPSARAAAESASVPGGAAGSGASPSGLVSQDFAAFDELIRQISEGQAAARTSAARMLADPNVFGVADLPMPTVETPLIEALHTMQSAPPTLAPDGAPRLASQLLDQARSKGSSLDQLTVEIVSLVFDYIYTDRLLPDVVKQQLLRLQVVAVKAALIDRSFFARRQHPMRRLIDRISEMATDPDADVGADSAFAQGIAAIVDWILANFDDDLSTFDVAMARLDVLAQGETERRAARLAEMTRAAERVEALGIAQDEANAEIALRIDAATPVFVREFLYREWGRALAQARVDGACGGASWEQSLQAAEVLIWSVAPKVPEEIARLASLLPRLIGALVKGLQAVGTESPVRERFFNELLQWHTRAIQDAKLNAARPTPAAAAALRMGADGTLRFEASAASATAARTPAPGPAPRTVVHAVVDALQRGDLLEVAGEDGVMRPLKVGWISPTRKLYVLTRFPGVGLSQSRSELVALFASGRARRVDAQSTLDRAIDAVAQSGAA